MSGGNKVKVGDKVRLSHTFLFANLSKGDIGVVVHSLGSIIYTVKFKGKKKVELIRGDFELINKV
jgi:hypothetical protein